MPDAWRNKLYFGDNLQVLREHVPDESVDLTYLDPPFNSNATYNVLFREKGGTGSSAQITAFGDSWEWGPEAERAYYETVTQGPQKLADLMKALRSFLGQNDMMAYLTMMAPRLVELHRVLTPSGSIYLHCDPTASHYLKLVMDAIFGPAHFLNEVVWKRSAAHSSSKRFGPLHDTILYYSKSERRTWRQQHTSHSAAYLATKYRQVDSDGRRWQADNLTAAGVRHGSSGLPWRGIDPTARGYHWKFTVEHLEELDAAGRIYWPAKGGVPRYKRYLDEVRGVALQDIWDDIPPINSQAQERLGYPTQKPEALLERIILASSDPGDVVLDSFCGCGTAIAVAERLGRRWIGIDITYLAIEVIQRRMRDRFGEAFVCDLEGIPKDLTAATALAHKDRFQFELWALGRVDAHSAHDGKKGADRGVDGYVYFFDDESGKPKKIVVQVKSGHVQSSYVRDLKGVVEREGAAVGALVTLEEPSKPMREEAVSAGFYEPQLFPGRRYPKLQILTVQQILDGAKIQYPAVAPVGSFKRADRHRAKGGEQGTMWVEMGPGGLRTEVGQR